MARRRTSQNWKRKRESWEKWVNDQIRARQVRIVGDDSGVAEGVHDTEKAIKMAESVGLDLVQMADGDPAVCRVLDYSKYKYEQKRKAKSNKSNAAKNEQKEVQIGPNIGDNDLENVKLKQVTEFLEAGCKVRITMRFKGRMIQHKDRGELLLLKIADRYREHYKIDSMPTLQGKLMSMSISPKK